MLYRSQSRLNILVLKRYGSEMDALSVVEIQVPPSELRPYRQQHCHLYTNQNFSGIVNFAYIAEDTRGGRAQATINVTVNTTPVAIQDPLAQQTLR